VDTRSMSERGGGGARFRLAISGIDTRLDPSL